MRNKQVHKWIMYHEVHKQHRDGLKPSQIAREMGMDRRTIKKYLSMTEEEYLDYIDNQLSRQRVLAPYENFVRTRLEACSEASSAQVHDWLKEHHKDFIDVDAKTVFNFVLYVRNKFGIPKPFNHREYEKVPELPYGQQTQVDFGVATMSADEGKRKKVYFICFVLSRSRLKYYHYSERPFTTIASIQAHEAAIQRFGGIAEEFVYDQDTLFLVDENKGDLILTEDFRRYVAFRGFKTYFCRKSDPESKGKVENIVRYAKYNFLRGRIFIDIQFLQGESNAWLDRTANAKVHSATRKVPHEEWLIEKDYLQTIMDTFAPDPALREYHVSKDNVVSYKGNFYRVPKGTYKPPKTTILIEITNDNQLIIKSNKSEELAAYPIYPAGMGQTVGKRSSRKGVDMGIDQLIDEMATIFADPVLAKTYFQKIRQDKPRYIRDQLLIINKLPKEYDMEIVNQALAFCVDNKIYRATDMEAVAEKLHVQQSQDETIKNPIEIKTINQTAHKIIPDRSNIADYQSLMN